MDVFDAVIIVAAVMAGVAGWRLGFLARVVSWIGLALGLYLAARFLPRVLNAIGLPGPSSQLAVAALVLIGGAVVGQALGLLVGARLHAVLPLGPLRGVDRGVGGLVGVLGVVVALWMLLPSVAAAPGWPARAARGSAISRWVSLHLPPPPDTLEVLRRIVGQDAPEVFAALRPGQATGPPPATSPLSASVTATVASSTVKVEGEACSRVYEGSGFAVGTDLVATNAHVVAGEAPGSTDVLRPDGRRLPATVVLFDPNRDLALLRVPGLGERPLPTAVAHAGAKGAVFGHPEGQDALAVTPASVAQEITAVGRDLYGHHTTRRDVLVLAAALAHGDSGGPLVDPAGDVIGVAFAIAADQAATSYALSTTELRADLGVARSGAAVATGSCLTS